MERVNHNTSCRHPFHRLDLDSVVLSDSPLDDYQRLYFASVYAAKSDGSCKTKRVTYKSNIAESFANPFKLPNEVSENRTRQNVLDCYEYQLPDVSTSKATCDLEFTTLSGTQKRNLVLDTCPDQLLKGSIIKDDGLPYVKSNVTETDDTTATLTKNQQFKLRKLDHNLQNNDKLINANNCILWTHDSGYVFLTGIWRLYQDVMRGLIHIPRKNRDSHDHSLQDICKKDLNLIIDYALYENPNDMYSPAANGTHWDRRKRRSSLGNDINLPSISLSNLNSASSNGGPTAKSSNNPNALSANYTDLHWNNLVPDLKLKILEMYRSYLVNEKAIPPNEVPDFVMTDIIKRIRGGYIKIQGTWLPLEIAKLICARFCFPIRYLLVPIFGKDFPKECEKSFDDIEKQVRKATTMETLPSMSRYQFETDTLIGSPAIQYSFMPTQKRRKKSDPTSRVKRLPPSQLEIPVSNFSPHATRNVEKQRSFSWAPDSNPLLRRKSSNEKLPPISTIMEKLSEQGSTITITDSYNQPMNRSQSQNNTPTNTYFARAPQQPLPQRFSDPTVQTLSHLATFYTTNGHKYSYPSNVYMAQQRVSSMNENLQNYNYEPRANSALYSQTHEAPAVNQMYYGFLPAKNQDSIKDNTGSWIPPSTDNFSNIQTSPRK